MSLEGNYLCYIQESHLSLGYHGVWSPLNWAYGTIFHSTLFWKLPHTSCCTPYKSTLQILTLTLLRDQGYPAGPQGSHITRAVSLGLVTSGTDRVIKALWWWPVKEQEDLISIHTRVRVMGKHAVELTNHGPTVQQMLGLLIMQVRVRWIWGLTYRSGWQQPE